MICPWFRTEVSSYFGFRVSHARVFSLLNSHTKVLFDPLCFETSQFEPGEVSLSEKMGVRNAGWSPPVVTVPRQRRVPVPTPVQSLGTSSREDPRDASAPRVTHRSAPASRTVRQVASRIFTRREVMAAQTEATMNVHTREIAKELSFEDISVHSPGLFRNGDAMRALKANPDTATFRRALAELNQTQDSLRKILDGATEKALGNGESDLERIKTNIKRLKFGTIELGTERAFLKYILESKPVPSAPPTESDEFKARNAELKRLKDANDAEEKQVEELVRAVGGAANAFAAEHAALATRVAALEQLEREAEAAELNAGEANNRVLPNPEDEKLSTEDARAALASLDAQARMVGAALRSRDREAAAMKASLEPEEAELASADAELKIIAGLGRTAQREAAATAQIAETRAVIAEQKTLIERLTGCAIVTSDPVGGSLVLKLTTAVDATPAPAMATVNDAFAATVPAPPHDETHTLTVTFHPGTTAVKGAALTPAGVPIDDIVATVTAMGAAEANLQKLVAEVKVRIAATHARCEALGVLAMTCPMDWSVSAAQIRVGLYGGAGGAVAAVDVPLEWPLNGAKCRVVGLAGLAPAVVAAAAQRVEASGYGTVSEALRATQDALAASGHVA